MLVKGIKCFGKTSEYHNSIRKSLNSVKKLIAFMKKFTIKKIEAQYSAK